MDLTAKIARIVERKGINAEGNIGKSGNQEVRK
jgi:hypothetical protein